MEPSDTLALLYEEGPIIGNGIMDSLLQEADKTKNTAHNAEQIDSEALEAKIIREQAQMSPIRKINTDILSEIFVAHSGMDWKAPTVLGAVCRLWRQVVLNTPQAWSYIQIGPRRCMNGVGLENWLQRCGGVGLHIYFPARLPSYFAKILSKFN